MFFMIRLSYTLSGSIFGQGPLQKTIPFGNDTFDFFMFSF